MSARGFSPTLALALRQAGEPRTGGAAMTAVQNNRGGASRRAFLSGAAGVTAGVVLRGRESFAQTARHPALGRIDQALMITPDQALDWNMFKAEGGPTYAGSIGWKRYTDFLIEKMQQ